MHTPVSHFGDDALGRVCHVHRSGKRKEMDRKMVEHPLFLSTPVTTASAPNDLQLPRRTPLRSI